MFTTMTQLKSTLQFGSRALHSFVSIHEHATDKKSCEGKEKEGGGAGGSRGLGRVRHKAETKAMSELF